MAIPLYWLVDADDRSVEVWTPESVFPACEREEIRWHPDGAAEPLVIQLAELYRQV
jgi:Uma2 family endonuclease